MSPDNNGNRLVIYKPEEEVLSLEVKLEKETVWLTQSQMSELFQTDRTSITKHIKNIYNTLELKEISTCAKFAQVQIEGGRTVERLVEFYNVEVMTSIGYRVKSKKGVQFRIQISLL